MSSINVKTILFISSTDKTYSHCFLFHCAKYWANRGDKVLYITHQPMDNLPLSLGVPRNSQNLENFNLIKFLYLPTWQDLLKHCYSIHLQSNPASVIIVQELENYCINDGKAEHDHVSFVCASLLQAAAICARKTKKPSYLINGFNSNNSIIYRTISKNFFHNIWQISVETNEDVDEEPKQSIRLSSLSEIVKLNDIIVFVFKENCEQSFLEFEAVFKRIITVCR